jgi:hypothetical protein
MTKKVVSVFVRLRAPLPEERRTEGGRERQGDTYAEAGKRVRGSSLIFLGADYLSARENL